MTASGSAPQLFGNLASETRRTGVAVVDHYNVQRVYDVYAGAEGRDLGGVAHDINRIVDQVRAKMPPGTTIDVRGQVQSMHEAFTGLGFGLAFAILLSAGYSASVDPVHTARVLREGSTTRIRRPNGHGPDSFGDSKAFFLRCSAREDAGESRVRSSAQHEADPPRNGY